MQQAEQSAQLPQLRRQPRRHAVILRAIQRPGQFVQHRQRLGRVEVVAHRGMKTFCIVVVGHRQHGCNRLTAQRGVEALQRLPRTAQRLFAVVDRAAVVAGQQQIANHLGLMLLQQLPDGEEIAERFRHLFVIDPHRTDMQPVAGKRLAGRTFRLGNLVLMVRKFQIGPATVHVESLTQRADRHRRTFDVPARTTGTPGRIPTGFARLGRLPQSEIERILLGLAHLDAGTHLQLLEVALAQPAIIGKAAHPIVDIAVAGQIAIAPLDQPVDQRDDLIDVVGGARLAVDRQDAERGLVFMHRGDEAVGQRREGFTIFGGTGEDLVIQIGDVANVAHLITDAAQVTHDHIKGHHHPGMAQMTVVIDGHAADIEADLARLQWLERLFVPAQRVVEGEVHRLARLVRNK